MGARLGDALAREPSRVASGHLGLAKRASPPRNQLGQQRVAEGVQLQKVVVAHAGSRLVDAQIRVLSRAAPH